MKSLKNIILLVASVVFSLAVYSSCGQGNEWKCGENLTATLKDGTLTIKGTGEMDDWHMDFDWFFDEDNWDLVDEGTGTIELDVDKIKKLELKYNTPWFDKRLNITQVVIQDGVTSIGENAFVDC